MEWWKANRHMCSTYEEVKVIIRESKGDDYKPDRAVNEIHNLRQTSTVQKYHNDMNRLNIYAKMSDRSQINIMVNSITSCLYQAMVH